MEIVRTCLLDQSSSSLYQISHTRMAVLLTYPLSWQFLQSPKGFWDNDEDASKFLRWVAQELHISDESLDDWYNISYIQFAQLGGKISPYHIL